MRTLLLLLIALVVGGATAAPTTALSSDPFWYRSAIRAPQVLHLDGGSPVVVAVIDTGVQATIPPLAGRVLEGRDLLDGGPANDDPYTHGTPVASVIAGRGAIEGVAPNAVVLPIRATQRADRNEDTVVRLTEAIRWATDQGARVINISMGTPPYGPLEDAVEYAWAHNVVIVASAGKTDAAPAEFPAGYRHVVAVGAVDRTGTRDHSSNWGVDLVAPGVGVGSAGPSGNGLMSGTSIAAPLVAGAAALLLEREPSLTNEEVVARLLASARDLGPADRDSEYGYGLLDVESTLVSRDLSDFRWSKELTDADEAWFTRSRMPATSVASPFATREALLLVLSALFAIVALRVLWNWCGRSDERLWREQQRAHYEQRVAAAQAASRFRRH